MNINLKNPFPTAYSKCVFGTLMMGVGFGLMEGIDVAFIVVGLAFLVFGFLHFVDQI